LKVALFSRYPEDSDYPKGGIESVTVVLVRALAQLSDMEVHLITLERNQSEVTVEQDGNVTIHRLPDSRWPQILDIIAGPGKKRLVGYINDLKPDILHTHETYGLCLGNISIPHVFTVHGFDHANLIADSAKFATVRSLLWEYVEKQGFSRQSHIISISPYVRKMIEPLTKAKIYDIDNPVDERFFNIKRRSEPGRILCTGWINERKNTLGAIEAFSAIVSRYPQARLIIAGQAKEQDYFDRVKQAIEQNKISDKVELLGHINHLRLVQELERADVFLLPSKQENSPMAIEEAMAAGVPVVVSNRCGMPYMVEEGKNGYLIDPESTENISDCLARLLESEQLCRQMGQEGHQIAVKRFYPETVAEKTVEVYKLVCSKS